MRRRDRYDVAVLGAIVDRPLPAFEILRVAGLRSAGRLYVALARAESRKFVVSSWSKDDPDSRRRLYWITGSGLMWLRTKRSELERGRRKSKKVTMNRDEET